MAFRVFESFDPFDVAVEVAFVRSSGISSFGIEMVDAANERIGIAGTKPRVHVLAVDVGPEDGEVRIIAEFQGERLDGRAAGVHGEIGIITRISGIINEAGDGVVGAWPGPEIIAVPVRIGWAIELATADIVIRVEDVAPGALDPMRIGMSIEGEFLVVVVRVHDGGVGELLDGIDAGGAVCLVLGLGEGWKQQGGKDGNDCDDDEKFDECEGPLLGRAR